MCFTTPPSIYFPPQVALDSKKRVFTWGFGGYGRLGHSEQKDEHTPRLVEIFARPGRGALQVYAGFSNSYAKNEQGMMFILKSKLQYHNIPFQGYSLFWGKL